MKRFILFSILFLLALCFIFTGCTPSDDGGGTAVATIKSISVHESSPKTFVRDGEFNLSEVRIVVEYKNGDTEIVSVSETMIDDVDRVKFNVISSSTTVLINYGGKSCPFSFTVTEPRQETLYNVHFESNGGTPISSKRASIIETFTLPEKEGYVFLGWYDNVECAGTPAKAPYEISQNTTFYADWQDNRRYNVVFLDINNNEIPALNRVIVHGNNIIDIPPAPIVEGYDFLRWDGQTDNIVSDVEIKSIYRRQHFYVNFYYNYDTQNPEKRPQSVAYGDSFSSSLIPVFGEREGYTGNWYILNENEETEPIYDSNGVVITEKFNQIKRDIDVIPVYEIIRLRITFQDDEFFRNTGTSWTNVVKEVDYGSSFTLNTGDNSDITNPATRVGHTSEWSVRISQQWINIRTGEDWNTEIREWNYRPIHENIIEYQNIAGETIAVISNGVQIENIKDNITIQAKYVRNKHKILFRRGTQNLYEIQNINYGTKFCLYNNQDNPISDITYGEMAKLEFVKYNHMDDWDIEWYPNTQFNKNEEVEFENDSYIVISGDMTYYCDDIDKRVYNVEFWDWDFETGQPFQLSIMQFNDEEWQEVFVQQVPHGKDPLIPTVNSKLQYGYELVDTTNFWHDASQDKGYADQVFPIGITKNMKFHARYRIITFSLTFRDDYFPYNNADDFTVVEDMPEVTYYKDDFGNDLSVGYVPMKATFFRDYGHIFTDAEVYFGGDSVYEDKLFIEQYQADWDQASQIDTEALEAIITEYQGYINEIKDYQKSVLEYTTTPQSTARYLQLIDDYNNYRQIVYDAEEQLRFYNNYFGTRKTKYDQISSDYNKYNNLFYQTTDREGFVFDGWYTSPSFNVSTRMSYLNEDNQIVTEITAENNLILYAKWIDIEKGSDGLVFQKVTEPNPNYGQPYETEFIEYYEVVDYISEDQFYYTGTPGAPDDYYYEIISIEGVDYYRNLEGSVDAPVEYISFNDLPTTIEELSSDVSIPSFHEGLPVKKIRKSVFNTNFDKVISVDLSKTNQTVEEGAFSPCNNLERITLSNENVYFMVNKGVLYSQDGSVLICYPAQNEILEYEYLDTEIIVPSSTFIVPSSVTRIAEGAFVGCMIIQHIAFEDTEDLTKQLVIGKKAFYGLSNGILEGGLQGVGGMLAEEGIYISDNTIPDRLVSIETDAFSGCWELRVIEATTQSKLIHVGENALTSTGWYYTKTSSNSTYLNGATSGGILMLGYVAITTTRDFTSNQIIFADGQVKAIADAAFISKTNLNYVTINSGIIYIGERAFHSCTNLSQIDCYIFEPSECELGALVFGSVGSLTIFIPNTVGVMEAYLTAPGWMNYGYMVRPMQE